MLIIALPDAADDWVCSDPRFMTAFLYPPSTSPPPPQPLFSSPQMISFPLQAQGICCDAESHGGPSTEWKQQPPSALFPQAPYPSSSSYYLFNMNGQVPILSTEDLTSLECCHSGCEDDGQHENEFDCCFDLECSDHSEVSQNRPSLAARIMLPMVASERGARQEV